MDDLLDLNWSSPSSSVRPSAPTPQKPRDAFADLLSTTPKPVDISKLSLAEQQRLQKNNASHSPWLTPVQASTPINSTTSSSIPRHPTPPNFMESKQSVTPSFDDLLSPFGNSSIKPTSNKNTPLNQLRDQTISPAENSSQWNLDLLDSTFNNTSHTTTKTIDPFDMDSLIHETKSFSAAPTMNEEDDNPLGILAQPAQRTPSPVPQDPIATVHQSLDDTNHTRYILNENEEDAMIIQLIDMGFSLQESKFAIEATGGNDLQSAVDLLVQNSEAAQRHEPQPAPQQHTEISATERARMDLFSEAPRQRQDPRPTQDSRQRQEPRQKQEPLQKYRQDQKEGDTEIQFQTEKIVLQAQEFGGFLYKNASSFLKTGKQKVTKAVGDWQEQQRAQRLQQIQEVQGGPIRPKWMTDGEVEAQVSQNHVEKFADDEDSDNEAEDLEAERRKIQELRRLQELKQREQASAAHKARQQQNLRKETLIMEEEVYVSPSRRRGNTPSSSGRSTPRLNTSSPQQPTQPPVTKSVPLKQNKRTRPVIQVSPDLMVKVNEARKQGNEKFKLGQFGEAEEAYTRAIETLPSGHDHQVLLCNNRAMARLKIGNYKKCVEDCDTAIELAKQSGDGSCQSEGVVIQWREQIIKALYRKAEALENIEKYKDALATYDDLVKLEGTANTKINQGMSRCRQALNPKASVPKKASPVAGEQKKEDFMSMFDPSANSSPPVVSKASAEELNKSKAVTAMRAKAAEQEAQDAEKLEKTDDVNARLVAWKAGKEQNLRALLATLDTLLWPGAQWKGAQMSELINPKKCKMTYMKAIGKVHPDKLPSDVSVEQRMLASGIFASLNEAWDSFKTQNNM